MNLINRYRNKVRVNLFIIGAQKCGTTSLFNYLIQSPSVIGSKPKEVDYFSYDLNYLKGEKWYHSHFKKTNQKAYYLDASVDYMYIPNTWERIKGYNKESKFLILLRNPIERAYSAYSMYKNLHGGYGLDYYENHILGHNEYYKSQMFKILKAEKFLTFEEYIDEEIKLHSEELDFWYEPGFLNRGIYHKQIKPYMENFKIENLLFIDSENLKKNKINVLKQICDWLNIDEIKGSDLDKNYLVGNYDSLKNNELYMKLKSFYTSHNRKLYELLNKDFGW